MNLPPKNTLDVQDKDTTISGNGKALKPDFDFSSIKKDGITSSDIKEEETNLLQEGQNFITGKQLLAEPVKEMDWLVKDLTPRVGMGALAGGSDLGKSALLRQLGIQLTTGENHFLGFDLIPKHHSVLIASTEDDSIAVRYLLHKQAGQCKPDKLEGLRFVFDYENLLTTISAILEQHPADMVIIDCFADTFGGDLKDTAKIRTYLSGWQQLAAKYECFVMFLHHTGKRTEDKEPSKNNLLSGQGFEAKMRLVIELRADLMNPDYRHFCIVKGNYLPAQMKKESYVLQFDGESFTFANTGERTPFELLVKQYEDGSKAKYEQAKELSDKGYSLDKVAKMMGYANKSSVSRLLAKGAKNEW